MASNVALFFDIFARDKTGGAVGKVGKQFDTLDAKVGRFAMRAAGAAALAAGAFAVQGVRGFLQFDDAMNSSLAIMGNISGPMRQKMEDAARTVGKTTRFGADQAAEAYFFLGSAGLDAQQSLDAMPRVAKFAQAGMFDLATATDLATDAQSALGLSVDDPKQNLTNLNRVMDVMVKTNTLANTSVQQLAEALTNKAAAASRAVGKDVEETSAVLAAFADQGTKGAEAGTQYAIVLRDLQTKAIANKDAFKEAGVAVFDADGNMRNMADIVGDLEGLLGGMSAEQQKATLQMLGFSDKSMGALQALLGTSDAIREYEAELRNAGGTTDEIANNQMKSFSARLDIVKSNVADFGISVGKVLVNAAFTVGQHIGEMASIFNELPGPVKIGIAAITGISAAVPVVAGVVGKIKAKHAELVASYRAMSRAGRAATLAMGGIGLALAVGATILSVFAGKSKEAADRQEAFKSTLDQTTGAVNAQTREIRAQELASSDMGQTYQELGLNMGDVLEATLGNEDAFSRLTDELDRQLAAGEINANIHRIITDELRGEKDAAQQASDEIARGAEIAKEGAAASGEAAEATDTHTEAALDNAGAVAEEVDEIQALIDTLDEATESIFASRDAEVRFEQAVDDAKGALKENGKTLDVTTEKGRKNRTALDNLAESALDQASAMLENGASHKKTQRKMADARGEFIRSARQMGMSREKARKLANQLGLIPGNYKANVSVPKANREKDKVKGANRELDKFGRKSKTADVRVGGNAPSVLQDILNKAHSIPRYISTTHTITSIGDYRPPPRTYGRAHGGPVFPGHDFMVGEQGPEIVRFGAPGHVFTASQSRRMLTAGTASAGPQEIRVVLDVRGGDGEFLRMIRKWQRNGELARG